MTKKKYKFYNQEIKEEYLSGFENETHKMLAAIPLRKAIRTEMIYDKDLFDLTIDELEGVIRDLGCSTANAAYNNTTLIEKYIDWAINKGYRRSNINPLRNIDKVKWSKNFVATYKNIYFTRDQIELMMLELVNPSDRALLLGVFEGIKGKRFAELTNLKEKDIREKDGKYQARLIDRDESVRVIEISELLYMTLLRSINTPYYLHKNGAKTNRPQTTFEQDSYVFKQTGERVTAAEIDHSYFGRRFATFKNVFGMRYLKAKHITDSGIMHMANELSEDESITHDNIIKIADHFNTPFVTSNAPANSGTEEYRNITLIKRILDMPEFEGLYGYKMKYTK